LKEKASACAMALSHLYHGCVLHAHPDHINFFGSKKQHKDVFSDVSFEDIANNAVVALACNIFRSPIPPYTIPDTDSVPALEQLLHLLPYHFVTGFAAGRVAGCVEDIAIEVMIKLISSSPSSPSRQIIANCTLLACTMVGVQFDRKDIIRIDKRCS